MALQNPLIAHPSISSGFHKKYTVSATEIAALGAFTSGDIILDTLPAGSIILRTRVKDSVAVAGTSFSAATARVITASNNYGSGALNVFDAVGTTSSDYITDITGASENFATTTPLLLHLTSTGGNLAATTAGSIDVWVDWRVFGL